jgi:hypothetical protein
MSSAQPARSRPGIRSGIHESEARGWAETNHENRRSVRRPVGAGGIRSQRERLFREPIGRAHQGRSSRPTRPGLPRRGSAASRSVLGEYRERLARGAHACGPDLLIGKVEGRALRFTLMLWPARGSGAPSARPAGYFFRGQTTKLDRRSARPIRAGIIPIT